MIYIFLGEDTTQSRNEFVRLKNDHKSKNTVVYDISETNIDQLPLWMDESQSLFGEKKAFFAENILAKKENRELLKKYDTNSTDSEIYIWEEKTEDRVAKFLFKYASIKTYKISSTVFKLLDGLYPKNIKETLATLDSLSETTEEYLIFYMICKRVRELIILKQGGTVPKLAAWQAGKMISQAQKWDEKKLLTFYDSLYKIDTLNKTSKTVYNLKKALDIIFTYFL